MAQKYRDRCGYIVWSDWIYKVGRGKPNFDNYTLLQMPRNVQIVQPTAENIQLAVDYDSKVAGMVRDPWCCLWLTEHSAEKSLMAVSTENGVQRCVGYIQMHEISLNRLQVSPMYADSEEIARQLFHNILKSFLDVENRDIFFGFVGKDERTMHMAKDLKLDIVDFAQRMCTKAPV